MQDIYFPELEPVKKRKSYHHQPMQESEYFTRSLFKFSCQPPSHPWSRILPNDLIKLQEKLKQKDIKKQQKRKSLPSPTFDKPVASFSSRRKKSGSFALNNTRSSASLLLRKTTNKTIIKRELSPDNDPSCSSLPPMVLHINGAPENELTFPRARRLSSQSFSIPETNREREKQKQRASSVSIINTHSPRRLSGNSHDHKFISPEEARKYVTLSWIKNYYTNTTMSYLEGTSMKGEPLCYQSNNLMIRLLYQQILTKSSSNITFNPQLIYDRNESLLQSTLNILSIMHDENIHEPNINVSTVSNPSLNPPKPDRAQESKYKKLNGKQSDIPSLEFESRFESGNLHRAIQVGPTEYDLLVSSDYNSQRHRQWFYFRVKNMQQNTPYRFNIVNYDKPDSVYNRGCKPCIYSEKRFKQTGIGWTRANTSDTYYYCNAFKNDYTPKFTEMQPQQISPPMLQKTPALTNLHISFESRQNQDNNNGLDSENENATKSGQSSDIDELEASLIMSNINSNLSPPKVSKRRKSASEASSLKSSPKKSKRRRRKLLHDNCYSENLGEDSRDPSLSRQLPYLMLS